MAGVTIEGVVEHGRRLGRELGFPTANMAVPDSVTAADGVYYSRAEVDGTLYDAMSNLGSNPSVGGAVRHLETHIFGFGGSLYGRTLRVELVRKIRDERRFATIGELRAQIDAVYDAGYEEWILWNASCNYSWEGLLKEEENGQNTEGGGILPPL